MAKIADKNCKKIYVTDDNPRNENPKNKERTFKKIFLKIKFLILVIGILAIKKAIKNSGANEIILIAGKGHEEKQIYKNKINIFSDKKIVKKLK